jgi:hypothetical protein
LIVDDEKDVHTATRLAIQDLRYKERPLTLLNAYSARKALSWCASIPTSR